MNTSTVWVIESSTEPNLYAAVSDGPAGPVLVWVSAFDKAIQFARGDDALDFATLHRMVDVEVEEYQVDQGFEKNKPIDPASAPSDAWEFARRDH